MEKKTDGKCVVCKGVIVELIIREYNPATGPFILGPGSKGQFSDVSHGFYCKSCGIKYQFILKPV